MPQRTTGEAAAVLADLVASPNELAAYQCEIVEARKADGELADNLLTAARFERQRHGAAGFDLATEAKAEAEELAEAIRRGDLGPKEARKALAAIGRKFNTIDDHHTRFEKAHEAVAEIEADPAAWADDLRRRYPSVRRNFSF